MFTLKRNHKVFQFPSNGKVFPNIIPNPAKDKVFKFQFPSNGKVFPNITADAAQKTAEEASFNSLQTGRYFRTWLIDFVSIFSMKCFNSLQTGRYFRTNIHNADEFIKQYPEFQFPSNGKVFPNLKTEIPPKIPKSLRFNSLQTGRYFRTICM